MAGFKVVDLMVLLDAAWEDAAGDAPAAAHAEAPAQRDRTQTMNCRGLCPGSLAICVLSSLAFQPLDQVSQSDLALLKAQLGQALEVIAKQEFELRGTAGRLDEQTAAAISEALDRAR